MTSVSTGVAGVNRRSERPAALGGLLGRGDCVPPSQQPRNGLRRGTSGDAAHQHVIAVSLPSMGQLQPKRAGHHIVVSAQHLVELAHAVEDEVIRGSRLRCRLSNHHRVGAGWRRGVHALILVYHAFANSFHCLSVDQHLNFFVQPIGPVDFHRQFQLPPPYCCSRVLRN